MASLSVVGTDVEGTLEFWSNREPHKLIGASKNCLYIFKPFPSNFLNKEELFDSEEVMVVVFSNF